MKKPIWALTAALLLLTGCTSSADPQTLAALENVMASVSEEELSPESRMAAELEDPCWDGEFSDGNRTITLSLEEDGSLHYWISDGGDGSAPEVSGAAANTETLHFALNGDTLSVYGGGYTGNYERK